MFTLFFHFGFVSPNSWETYLALCCLMFHYDYQWVHPSIFPENSSLLSARESMRTKTSKTTNCNIKLHRSKWNNKDRWSVSVCFSLQAKAFTQHVHAALYDEGLETSFWTSIIFKRASWLFNKARHPYHVTWYCAFMVCIPEQSFTETCTTQWTHQTWSFRACGVQGQFLALHNL